MRLAMRFVVISALSALLGMSSFASRIATRPASSYGALSNTTVVSPTSSGGFTQAIVCGGDNTSPGSTTTCSLNTNVNMNQPDAVPGVFDLLVDVPSLSSGTLIKFNLDGTAFNSTLQDFGLLTDCQGSNLNTATTMMCTSTFLKSNPADQSCISSIFNGWGGSGAALTLTVPSCATGGFSVVFDETKPSLATISTESPVGTPEPRTIVLLGAGMLAFAFLYKRA